MLIASICSGRTPQSFAVSGQEATDERTSSMMWLASRMPMFFATAPRPTVRKSFSFPLCYLKSLSSQSFSCLVNVYGRVACRTWWLCSCVTLFMHILCVTCINNRNGVTIYCISIIPFYRNTYTASFLS